MKKVDPHESGETKIDSAVALRVYQKIVDHGRREGDAYRLEGLTATSDYDGYGVTLTDGAVTIRVLFHNRVQVDARGARALENFRKRLLRVYESF